MTLPAHCPALLVSAPASGQGKTSVTAALARWHTRQGRRVRVFKTGPDFLDPLLLERASGAPVFQLDLWMTGEADIRQRLHAAACDADLLLIEGVMGLFDGAPSSADLAVHFGIPVLAVIDGAAMAQTFGALALGLARYRDDLPLYGVAANRIGSAHHARLLRESVPPSLQWLGALPRAPALQLPERRLGLVAAAEVADLEQRLDALADAWAAHASTALPPPLQFAPPDAHAAIAPVLQGVRIAIARDAAFCFVYPANLELLAAVGVHLQFFSPIAGDALPDCDAVWLPGGYPEASAGLVAASRSGCGIACALRTRQAAAGRMRRHAVPVGGIDRQGRRQRTDGVPAARHGRAAGTLGGAWTAGGRIAGRHAARAYLPLRTRQHRAQPLGACAQSQHRAQCRAGVPAMADDGELRAFLFPVQSGRSHGVVSAMTRCYAIASCCC